MVTKLNTEPLPKTLGQSIPTRRSLLSRLKQWDDQESWQDFFNTYWKLIYGVALRAGLSACDADDVVQETIIAVAKQIPHFRYDPALGSFKSWLLLITRRRINDHLRKEYRRVKAGHSAHEETGRTTAVERIPDPLGADLEAIWEEEWKQGMFEAALQRVKRQVDPAHFQIFDCYALKEWPVKDVVSAFGVKASRVYLIKHRIAEMVAKEIRRLEVSP
jgi:RNA polymerase sigma-70 factor (ECF subfamily)